MDKHTRMEIRKKAGCRNLPEPPVKTQCPAYSMSYACFICHTSIMRHFDVPPCDYPKTMKCPICKSTTVNLGRHFKPPKKSDVAQWKKIKFLAEHGFVFQKIRTDSNSYDSVPYPDTLPDAREFVVKYKKWAWAPIL